MGAVSTPSDNLSPTVGRHRWLQRSEPLRVGPPETRLLFSEAGDHLPVTGPPHLGAGVIAQTQPVTVTHQNKKARVPVAQQVVGEAVSVVGEEGRLGTGDSVSWPWLVWAGPLSSTLPAPERDTETETDGQTEIQGQRQTEAPQGAGGLGGTCAWLDDQERLQVRERHPQPGAGPPPHLGPLVSHHRTPVPPPAPPLGLC